MEDIDSLMELIMHKVPFGAATNNPDGNANMQLSSIIEEKIAEADAAIGREDDFLSSLSPDAQTAFKLGVDLTLEEGAEIKADQELIADNLQELSEHVFDNTAAGPPAAQPQMTKFGEGLKNLLKHKPDFAEGFGTNMNIETGPIEALNQTFKDNREMDASDFFEPYGEEFAAAMANLPEEVQHTFIEKALEKPDEFEKFAQDANADPHFKNITAETRNVLEEAESTAQGGYKPAEKFATEVLANEELNYETFKESVSGMTASIAMADENGNISMQGIITYHLTMFEEQLPDIKENLPPQIAEFFEKAMEQMKPMLEQMEKAFGEFDFDFLAEQSTDGRPGPEPEAYEARDADGNLKPQHEAGTGLRAPQEKDNTPDNALAPGTAP